MALMPHCGTPLRLVIDGTGAFTPLADNHIDKVCRADAAQARREY
jgi:hypothetical protein